MSSSAAKSSLSPQERRLVAGIGLVVFVVLNFVFVWPHFGDRRKVQEERDSAERKLARYQAEVKNIPKYQVKLTELENQGQLVVPEDQELYLANTIEAQARANRLTITQNQPRSRTPNTQTNQFFEEQAVQISVSTGTEELVNFLMSLTSPNSLIRVKDMDLRPDPPQAPIRLQGTITLVASYQKKPPAKPATVATKSPAPASKPTGIPPRSTNLAGTKKTGVLNTTTNKALSASTNRPTAPKNKSSASLPKS